MGKDGGMEVRRRLENIRRVSLLTLILVFDFCCLVSDVHSLDTNQCTGPLGMETGEILDSDITSSSSFDASNVGPQNGRVRVERGGGAWCPKTPVTSEAEEWLQIDLHIPHVITATEIQGRFGNGQGMEYAESYLGKRNIILLAPKPGDLNWRIRLFDYPTINAWKRYVDRDGNAILKGNINTYLSKKVLLDPHVITSKLRIMPHSNYRRTVCLRIEIYGCPLRGGLLSYSMPQGSIRGEGWDFYDHIYDGVWDGQKLSSGLGALTDGRTGSSNLKDEFYKHDRAKGWVGWKNETRNNTEALEIVFQFDSIREFKAVNIHVSNQFSEGVQVFEEARIYFSKGGKIYQKEPIIMRPKQDCIFEDPRYIEIKTQHRIASQLKIVLYWPSQLCGGGTKTKWILISEVNFDSLLAIGNFENEEISTQKATTLIPFPTETFKTKKNEQHQTTMHQIPEDISDTVGASSRVTEDWSVSSFMIVAIAITSSFLAIVLVLAVIGCVVVVRHKLVALVKVPGSSRSSLQYAGASVHVVNGGPNGPNVEFTANENSPAKVKTTQLSISTSVGDYHEPMTSNTNFSSFKGSTSTSTSTFNRRRGSFNDGHGQKAEFYSCSLVSNAALSHNNTDSCNEYEYVLPTTEFGKYKRTQFLIQSKFKALALPEVDRVKVIRILGENGNFGTVFVGELEKCDVTDRRLVIVKRMLNNASEKDKLDFIEEIRLLITVMDHPNISQVIGVNYQDWSVVLEFLELGDLCQFLRQSKLSLGDILFMACQIADGMKYFESRNIVHRDLAARNCIVGRGLAVKISHFASDMDIYVSDYYRLDGKTPFPIRWMAWESIYLGKYSTRSDVWSFGVTLWEMLCYCRHKPYHALTNQAVITNLQHFSIDEEVDFFQYLEKPPNCPRDIYQLLCDTWCRSDEDRPTFWEIHCFLSRKNITLCADLINREIPNFIEAHHTQQYIV